MVKLIFVGTGDAFGSGGRMNTCLYVETSGLVFAIDFGATSLAALNDLELDHGKIDLILLTHFHGDHAAGIPGMLLDSMVARKRTRPLTIAGPPGVEAHLAKVMSAFFPGSEKMMPNFPMTWQEIAIQAPQDVMGLRVKTYPAAHTPETMPTSMRIETSEGKVIAFTGDSAWTEHMPDLAAGSDVFISECYFHEKPVPNHMNYPALRENRDRLKTKRLILTHMGPEMLAMADEVPEETAYDGMVIEI